jgi:hypothetical protein
VLLVELVQLEPLEEQVLPEQLVQLDLQAVREPLVFKVLLVELVQLEQLEGLVL